MAKYTKIPQSDIESTSLDYNSAVDYSSVFTYDYPDYFSHGGHSKKFKSAFTYVGGCDPNFKKETLDSVKPNMVLRVCAGMITVFFYVLMWITIPVSYWICFKKVQQFERLVVFRIGRLLSTKGPGMVVILPCIDKYKTVDLRLKAFSVPPQSVMTADNGGIELGAEIYHHIKDAVLCVNNVQDLNHSMRVISQTTLQRVLSKYHTDEIEAKRGLISQILLTDLNKMALQWGTEVTKVELSPIKVLVEPNQMLGGNSTNPMDILGQMLFPPGSNATAGAKNPMQQIAGTFFSGMAGNQSRNAVHPTNSSPHPDHTAIDMDLMGAGDSVVPLTPAKPKRRLKNAFDLLEVVKPILNHDLIAEFRTVYKFVVNGESGGTFYLDLKNGTGSVGLGEPPFGNPDVTMTLHSRDLESLLNEELSPVAAYMTGRLEVDGDTQMARQLSQLIEIVNKNLQ